MDSIRRAGGKEQVPEEVKTQKPQQLTSGGPLRDVQVAVPRGPQVSKKSADVEFQPLGKRNIQASEDAWVAVDAYVGKIGVDANEWQAIGDRDQRAEALLDAIEGTFAEEGIESEFATEMLGALSALTCAIGVDEAGGADSDLQQLNLARSVALLGGIVRDFGDQMSPEQTGLVLQAVSNIYTNKSADAATAQYGAILLENIADRCVLAEGSNQREVLLEMLAKPPSRFKGDPDFLMAHAQAISTTSAALDGLTGDEVKLLFKGIEAITKRTTDEGVREACLEALQNLESFAEPKGPMLKSIQALERRLENLLS